MISAFVPSVGVPAGLSQPAEPSNQRRSVAEPTEQAPTVNEPPGLTPDNTPIDPPRQSEAGPAQDFGHALEEQIQAKGSEKVQNPTQAKAEASGEAPQAGKQASAEESEAGSAETSAAVTVVLAKTNGEMADLPEPEAPAETSKQVAQLPNVLEIQGLADLAAKVPGQTIAKSLPAGPESGGEPPQIPVEQSQIESKVVEPALSKAIAGPVPDALSTEGEQVEQKTVSNNALAAEAIAGPVPDAVSAEGKQVEQKAVSNNALAVEQKTVSNNALAAKQGTATEQGTRELAAEPLAKDAETDASSANSGDTAKQNVTNTAAALHENPAESKQESFDAQSGPGGPSPRISTTAFGEPDGKAVAERQSQALSESPDGSGKEAGAGEKALPADSLIQKLSPAQVQVTIGQAKGRNTVASDSNPAVESEQVVPVNSPRISGAEQPFNAPQTAKAIANPSAGDVSASVSEQVQESIRSSVGGPDQQITIRLNPPELGKVVVKFQEQDDQITGLLEVSKAQTRAEIQQALPEITRNLQELGVQVKRLEVVLTSEHERQTLNGESATPQQDNWATRQESPNPDGRDLDLSVNDLLVNGGAYNGFTGRTEAFITDKSIDMLA